MPVRTGVPLHPALQERRAVLLNQAHLCISLEIWVESVPLRGKMRYNVGARLIAPPGCADVLEAQA